MPAEKNRPAWTIFSSGTGAPSTSSSGTISTATSSSMSSSANTSFGTFVKTVEAARPVNLDQVIGLILKELASADLPTPRLLHLAHGSWTMLEEALGRLEKLGLVVRKDEAGNVVYGLTNSGKEAVALPK